MAGERHDPIGEFQALLERARDSEVADPTALVLATADGAGRPSARVVLLKGVDQRGFSFFTNYGSRKAKELKANPNAALCVHWPSLQVQVRIEGTVQRLSEEESDEYFATRPRASQIAAWASWQSRVLESPEELVERCSQVQERFAEVTVPRPEFWGGYLLTPLRIEFWRGRSHRLHERGLYESEGGVWSLRELYP